MVEKFAKNSEIKMLVEERQINTRQFKKILSRNKIFSFVRNSEELSEQIYPFFFGFKDINYMQELMESPSNYKRSSMIKIKPLGKYDSIDEFIDDINDDIQRYRNKDMRYKIEYMHKDKEQNIHMKMSYYKRGKGKTELIKFQKREIDIKIEKIDDEDGLLIDIRQKDNSDLKEFEIFIEELNKVSGQELFSIESLTLNKLKGENKIKFFDELIKYNHKKWSLTDIKGIDCKKSKSDDTDDQDTEEVSTSDIAGINSAIFKGDGIRDNGIVKKFENQGFHFVSMKFKYVYRKSVESFIIDINFKNTDNIKVDIVKTFDKDDNDNEIISILPMNDQEEIIIEFQKVARKVYDLLICSQ